MKLICTLFFFSIPLIIKAQQTIELAAFTGFANYQGDLSEAQIEFGETKLSFGAFMRYHHKPKWIFKGNVFLGVIEGDDDNAAGPLKDRGLRFKSNLVEVGMQAEYHPLGRKRYSNTGIFRRQISPYVATGLALAYASADLDLSKVDETLAALFPEAGDKDSFLAVPIVAGVRIDIFKEFALGFEWGWRAIFSDYLDNVSKNGNDKKYDWYLFVGATASYFFGGEDNFDTLGN